ncbi:hypothetical protein BX661DRAFT_134204, partial [Kickxella alabastrina]
FADNFWSLDERCISVLMHKLKNAKQTSCDILQMVSTRATMEDDLGKKLAKLSRAGLGTEEVGSIKDALRTVRAEMESNAKCHLELARQLRTEIEKPLSSFINDQRAKRRAQTSIIQKTEGDRNSLRSQLRKLQDKRRGDTKKVGDLDLQVNGLQGVGDPKLRTKLDRAQMQQKATENEYVDVRERLKDADQQWYNVWRSACDVFQVLEEERIEYLKTCLWTFTNLISSSCVADDESMERIRQDLEKISVADDIAEFIQTFGTGAPDPELALGQPAAGGDTDRGMHNGQAPGQMMQAPAMHYGAMGMPPNAGPPQPVYRSATPVQQSPQYVGNMMSRPPTQMSHSPVSRVHPQQMGSAVPSPQMNQRVPSVMSGNYQHPHHTQQQQHAAPAATNSSAVAGANQLSESGKEILFYVKVLYDYDADNNKELTIREGDVISVLAVSADGWWDGEMTDRRTGRAIQGTFPSNF